MEFMASQGCFYFEEPLKNIDIYTSIEMKVFFYCIHHKRASSFTIHALIRQPSDFLNRNIFSGDNDLNNYNNDGYAQLHEEEDE